MFTKFALAAALAAAADALSFAPLPNKRDTGLGPIKPDLLLPCFVYETDVD